jgi:hypothetical protein
LTDKITKGHHMQLIIVVLLAFLVLKTCSSDDAPREAEALRIENSLLKEQDKILLGLTALDNPSATIFVSDWRRAYPEPTDANLFELRQIEQQIAKDKSNAFRFTLDYHERNDVKCQVSSPFGDNQCRPGL